VANHSHKKEAMQSIAAIYAGYDITENTMINNVLI